MKIVLLFIFITFTQAQNDTNISTSNQTTTVFPQTTGNSTTSTTTYPPTTTAATTTTTSTEPDRPPENPTHDVQTTTQWVDTVTTTEIQNITNNMTFCEMFPLNITCRACLGSLCTDIPPETQSVLYHMAIILSISSIVIIFFFCTVFYVTHKHNKYKKIRDVELRDIERIKTENSDSSSSDDENYRSTRTMKSNNIIRTENGSVHVDYIDDDEV